MSNRPAVPLQGRSAPGSMHICFDFRPALRQGTGVGTYVHNLALALSESFPDDDYTLFSASWKDRVNGLGASPALTVADRRIPVRLLDWAWHRWRWPPVERFVGPVDVAHSPSPMLLPARRASTIVTVHDCYFLLHPEDVFGAVRRDYVPLARRAAADADAVAVVSETTAAQVEELLGVDRHKIRVTRLGVHREFFDAAAADPARLAGHGIDRPFLLFVGRREKRKDLGTLLAAFEALGAESGDLLLVLAGPDAPGWSATWEGASSRVRTRTRVLGHQGSEQLPALYAAATATVIPSRWEGFGLTGLESMAAGTPVVATEVGSLPEILGDAALFAPPSDPEALAAQCRRLLDDSELRGAMRERGRAHAAGYRWSETARRTHELYRSLAG